MGSMKSLLDRRLRGADRDVYSELEAVHAVIRHAGFPTDFVRVDAWLEVVEIGDPRNGNHSIGVMHDGLVGTGQSHVIVVGLATTATVLNDTDRAAQFSADLSAAIALTVALKSYYAERSWDHLDSLRINAAIRERLGPPVTPRPVGPIRVMPVRVLDEPESHAADRGDES